MILGIFVDFYFRSSRIPCRNRWILLHLFLFFDFGGRLDMVEVVGSNPIPPTNTPRFIFAVLVFVSFPNFPHNCASPNATGAALIPWCPAWINLNLRFDIPAKARIHLAFDLPRLCGFQYRGNDF